MKRPSWSRIWNSARARVDPQIDDYVEQDDELVSQDFADVIPAVPVAAVPIVEPAVRCAARCPRPIIEPVAGDAAFRADPVAGLWPRRAAGRSREISVKIADNTARWGVQAKPAARRGYAPSCSSGGA